MDCLHPYKISIIEGSGSGKTNSLFNVINQQPVIDKVYSYAKDQYEAKYQFLFNKREGTGLTLFRIGRRDGGQVGSLPFSPVTSTNVGISSQNVLTFSLNPFVTLV